MSDQFVAEIRIFGCNFAPNGWAFCNGQILPISQNTALFSLLGTTYGGDGKSNFALPNMQGNVPMQEGNGAGLSQRFLGETGGSPTVTLLQTEMPVHTHTMQADALDIADTNVVSPTASFAISSGGTMYQPATNAQAAIQALSVTGSSFPHNNLQPYLSLNFCIALQGIFPARPAPPPGVDKTNKRRVKGDTTPILVTRDDN
jgi:microcystin-dependent protein